MAWNLKELNAGVIPVLKNRLTTAKTIAIDVAGTPGIAGGTYNFQSPYVAGPARTHSAADRAAKNAFIFDDVVDTTTPITLDGFVYKGTELTYDFETFAIWELGNIIEQSGNVVAGKVNALVGATFDAEVAAVTNANAVTLGATNNESADIILNAVLKKKTAMDTAGVDTAARTLVVSPLVGEILLGSDKFSNADKAGDASALREATIGRVYGFDVVIDTTMSGLGAVAYEKFGFGLIVRPKAKPVSATVASETTLDGDGRFVLSSTVGFDTNLQSDKLIVGAFVGLGKLDPARSAALRFVAAPTA